jgi:C4-dicarboxylate transporter DctM subunit
MFIFVVIVLLVLSIAGMPIALALGIGSLGSILIDGTIPLSVVSQKVITGMNSFSLMAIPFFILSGDLMSGGGLTRALMNIARKLVGWVRGSISIVSIVSSAFFGAVTGSAIATASAIGGMTIPEMIEDGYEPGYAAAVSTAGAILGPLIPPSIGLIVYASITSASVQALFKGTLLPGLLFALAYCSICYYIAKKRNYRTRPRAGWKEIFSAINAGKWAILMPVIVLGCIFSGITTATEASVIAVAYSLIIGMFVHKDLKVKDLPKIFLNSAVSTAAMYLLIGFSNIVGWIIAITNVSVGLTNWILSINSSKWFIVSFITILGLILGCLMDVVAVILILTPILYSLVLSIGYTPVEFGVILSTIMMLGHITPPVGASLLLSNSIAKADIMSTVKESIPFLLASIIMIILLWIFPQYLIL